MDRNDLLRKIDNLKAALAPKLAAYRDLAAGAVDDKGKDRAFTAEEFEKHETIGKEINEINSQIATARAVMRATQLSDADDELTADRLGLGGAEKLPHATDEYTEKFLNFMRNGADKSAAAASEIYKSFGPEFQNLDGTSPSTGAVLIPRILERSIMQEAAMRSPLMMVSNVVTVSNRLNQIPFIGDIGVLAPRGEAETYVKTEPALEGKNLDIHNFGGLFPVSNELLEDAEQLQAMFGPIFGRALAETIEEYGLKGDDGKDDFTKLDNTPVTLTLTNKVPPGILTLAAGVVPVQEAESEAGITYVDLIRLMQKVKSDAKRNGTFLLASDAETATLLLKDLDGRPLWMPNIVAGQPATIMGKPYHVSDRLDSIGFEATTALFGDFGRAHRIAIKKGLTVKTSGHFYFANNSLAVAADVRWGSLVLLKEYIAKLVHPEDDT